jgi:hypothetical protein
MFSLRAEFPDEAFAQLTSSECGCAHRYLTLKHEKGFAMLPGAFRSKLHADCTSLGQGKGIQGDHEEQA